MLSKLSKDYFNPKVAILAAILIGSALRLTVYFQNRSFIIDEANLARNIVEKDYVDFFKPLDYEQYSPPIFSCALKTMTQLFGVNEYSLTLISLLAGIGTLILLFLIARQLDIEWIPLLYLLLAYSFSMLAVRYSSELKQYSLDAFLCLLFIFWILRKQKEAFSFFYALQLAFFGSIVIWASMPIVFVLAAIGIHLLLRFYKKRDFNFAYLFLIGSAWLISFGLYYFSILKVDAGTDYLQNFHGNYFFDFIPMDKDSLVQNYNLLLGLFRSVTDKTVVSLIGSILFFGVGLVSIIRHKKVSASLLLLPVLFCLLASHFKMYSLLTRLTLFMIPLLSLVFIYGFSSLWKKSNKYVKVLMILFALLSLINKKAYEHFWTPFEVEDSKTTLNYLKEHVAKDETIFVHHSAVPAFVFYNQMHDQAYGLEDFHLGKWGQLPGEYLLENEALDSGDLFWLFFSHTEPVKKLEKDIRSAESIARKQKEKVAEQSFVQQYLVE